MLDSSNVDLRSVFVHRIGNRFRQEGIVLSSNHVEPNQEHAKSLLSFFFNHFSKSEKISRLSHPAGPAQNAVLSISKSIFAGNSIDEQSRRAAEHLYDVSDHPKINAGNLFVAYFRNLKYQSKQCDAVGYFKSDHTDNFFTVQFSKGASKLIVNEGTRVTSFDKGALVLNIEPDDGYRVLQAVSHSDEAAFWTDKFLKTTEVFDAKTHTRQLLALCKTYCQTLPEGDASDRVRFLSSAYGYLNENEHYDEREFIEALPPDSRVAFKELSKGSFPDVEKVPETFLLSTDLLKKQKAVFKSVISLDSNIEIRISPLSVDDASQAIEKGYDPKRKKHFYKIYFAEES